MTLNKFEEFEQFKKERYEATPWDFGYNPQGFPAYKHGASDISAHLPILSMIASQCDHITEFGCRNAFSTTAFIAGCTGKVISYDIQRTDASDTLEELNRSGLLPCEWWFQLQSTTDASYEIEQTDFLFLDTLHTFATVEMELRLHGKKVNRFLAFHDTFSQGENSLDVPGEEGINRAISEFMARERAWEKVLEIKYNHGLLILGKR